MAGTWKLPATVSDFGISTPPPKDFQFQVGPSLVFPSLYTIRPRPTVYTVHCFHCICSLCVSLACRLRIGLSGAGSICSSLRGTTAVAFQLLPLLIVGGWLPATSVRENVCNNSKNVKSRVF